MRSSYECLCQGRTTFGKQGLVDIALILLLYYLQLTPYDVQERYRLFASIIILVLGGLYFTVQYLKKSGKWVG